MHKGLVLTILIVGALLSGCDNDSKSNNSGNGGNVVEPLPALPAPTALAATSTEIEVTLGWDAVDMAASYAVFRCPLPAGETDNLCATIGPDDCGEALSTTAGPGYDDMPPATDAFCYQVQACRGDNGDDCGAVSESVPGALKQSAPLPEAVAIISDDGRFIYAGQPATLHGWTANEPAGTARFSWEQRSGPKVSNLAGSDTATISFTAPIQPGLITFVLTVADDNGLGRTAKAAIQVLERGNILVKASASSAARAVKPGDRTSLHAVASASSGSPLLEFNWFQLSPLSPEIILDGGDTANPSFTVPNLPGSVLRFQVTATDPATGLISSDEVAVVVARPVPTTPSQQALTVQLPVSQIVAPPLSVWTGPALTAFSNDLVSLAVSAAGGKEPYSWEWQQISGPAAVFQGGSEFTPAPQVQLPGLTASVNLEFVANVTDADGTLRTGHVIVQLHDAPPVATVTAPPLTALPSRTVYGGDSINLAVALSSVTVDQVAGPVLATSLAAINNGAQTEVTVAAPDIQQNRANATLHFAGTDSLGRSVIQTQEIEIVRPPSKAPPAQAPTLVAPKAPALHPNLVVPLPSLLRADEGQDHVQLSVSPQGGDGTYSYQWTYLPVAGIPSLTLTDASTRTPSVSLAGVDVSQNTQVLFQVEVTSGLQTATVQVPLEVDNVVVPTGPAPLVAAALTPLTVTSGDTVYLHAPAPTGGMPPYAYSIAQTGGPAVTFDEDIAGNWRFTAPSLNSGDADVSLDVELSITDSGGSAVKVTQRVTVKAPGYTGVLNQFAAAPALNLLNNNLTDKLEVVPHASGGAAPYGYRWTVTPDFSGATPMTSTDESPTFDLPTPPAGVQSYTMQVDLEVTDSSAPPQVIVESRTVTVNSSGTIAPQQQTVQAPSVPKDSVANPTQRTGSVCLLCGNSDQQSPCTDLDLILAISSQCPDTEPYCANSIRADIDASDPSLRTLTQYRHCASGTEANEQWYQSTRLRPDCQGSNDALTPGVFCHFVCYGDDCNTAEDASDVTPGTAYGVDGQGYATPRVD